MTKFSAISSMHLLRPATGGDVDGLVDLFTRNLSRLSGISSLRPDKERLASRVAESMRVFASSERIDGEADHFCVLEDISSGRVVGTTAAIAGIGDQEPFYSFKLSTRVHRAADADLVNRVETLFLTNDYTGCTEVASLFLDQAATGVGSGVLLSFGRFLLMAQHPERFDTKVFAEMRGYQDADGSVPVWDGLGHYFFPMSFEEADRRCALGQKAFIASLFPDHPIYVPLLSERARDALGRVHPDTEPALHMLKSQGFRWERYVDVFDGGATVEAERDQIAAVRDSREMTVVDTSGVSTSALIATTGLADFRCVRGEVELTADTKSVGVTPELREVLGVDVGALVRVLML